MANADDGIRAGVAMGDLEARLFREVSALAIISELLDSYPLPIIVFDETGEVKRGNLALARNIGLASASDLSCSRLELLVMHESDAGQILEMAKSGGFIRLPVPFRTATGEPYMSSWTSSGYINGLALATSTGKDCSRCSSTMISQ